jgi:hypothetical protein
MLIVALLACDGSGGTSTGGGGKSTYTITYRVMGTTDSASVTYSNEHGDTEQISDVDVPWNKTIKAEPGQFLYISAQNNDDSGTIVTRIEVDSVRYKESKSEGAYVIASCSGTAGGE